MSEPVIHWNISPKLLDEFLQRWVAANPPVKFWRKGKQQGKRRNAPIRQGWLLTETGRADLEARKVKNEK